MNNNSRRNPQPEPQRMAIRTYGKSELAMLYFPDSQPHTAVNHLMAWIRRCGPLNEELKSQHYVRTAKCFTPRQVETILRHLGEPLEKTENIGYLTPTYTNPRPLTADVVSLQCE